MRALVEVKVEWGPGGSSGRLIDVEVEDFSARSCLKAIIKYHRKEATPKRIDELMDYFIDQGRMAISIAPDPRNKDKMAFLFKHVFKPGDLLILDSDNYINVKHGIELITVSPMPESLELLSRIDRSDAEAVLNL